MGQEVKELVRGFGPRFETPLGECLAEEEWRVEVGNWGVRGVQYRNENRNISAENSPVCK